ncbi:hypothetical protein D3C73_738190 [compost metagenome]
MHKPNLFEELRDKYVHEDRAKLVMLQVRKLMDQKKKKKWYHSWMPQPKTKPKNWND